MQGIINSFNNLKFILNHPLNRDVPFKTLARLIKWQLGSRLLPGSLAVPFVGNTRLLVQRGMTGASGNIYCGLHEFEDMTFVLHALRPGDLFVDVGANIGSYTVLAGGVSGASVVAIEPIPKTFQALLDNIRLNRLDALVTAKNVGVGSVPGSTFFTENFGAGNYLVAECKMGSSNQTQIQVETLDGLLHGLSPTLMKIDVEGYETEVIKGGDKPLKANSLLAVLLEVHGVGRRYGFDEDKLHQEMLQKGFVPCRYQPFDRKIIAINDRNKRFGNTLYVRDESALQRRLESAPKILVHGQAI
jgi:FkbM family methyltransferase